MVPYGPFITHGPEMAPKGTTLPFLGNADLSHLNFVQF